MLEKARSASPVFLARIFTGFSRNFSSKKLKEFPPENAGRHSPFPGTFFGPKFCRRFPRSEDRSAAASFRTKFHANFGLTFGQESGDCQWCQWCQCGTLTAKGSTWQLSVTMSCERHVNTNVPGVFEPSRMLTGKYPNNKAFFSGL